MTFVRVAVVSESFLPAVNGVTNSVLRVLEHLEGRGHDAVVLAPGRGPRCYAGAEVVRVRSVPLPRYHSFSLGLPSLRVMATLRAFAPDVVHLASPFALGAHGALAACRLGLAAVAVYQTDVAGFLSRYRLGMAGPAAWRWLARVHGWAALTLAPSTAAMADLRRHGVGPLALWRRGVDTERFHPRQRDEALRRWLAPGGELLVGYVGRLAPEKRVGLLRVLGDLPGCRVVVVGDGPQRGQLQAALPFARFLGLRTGRELASIFASLDVFVHTGANETFCQAAQEALASGVPVVAPAAGGLLDLVRDGESGLLWAPDDPAALRGAVGALAADPEARAAYGRAARSSVAGRTWASVGDQLLAHYATVLRGGPRRAAA
jgi:phosphatidylinositol alpha 1,6-mannosyltransferase